MESWLITLRETETLTWMFVLSAAIRSGDGLRCAMAFHEHERRPYSSRSKPRADSGTAQACHRAEDVLAGLPMPEHSRRPAVARPKVPAAAQAAQSDWIRPARRNPIAQATP